MKIGLISLENPYNPQNNGGIGTYTGVMAEALAQRGNEIHLVTVGTGENEPSRQIMPYLMIHYISSPKAMHSFYLEQMVKIFCKLKEIEEKYGLDIVEVPEWAAQGFMVANESLFPVVTRLHTPLFLIEDIGNGQRLYRESEDISRFERLQTLRSRAVTSPSASLAEVVRERWGVESTVISNPINVKKFESANHEKCRGTEEDYFLFLGRLEYRKGVLVLAECLKEVLENAPGIDVVFCGQNTYYKKRSIQALVLDKCSGFQDRLRFIDHACWDSKVRLIRNARAVVLPSLWENFSYAALEAMCLGKTVIATRSGGFTEMIEHGVSGYLVEPGNSEDLGRVLMEMLNSHISPTGLHAAKSVQEKYDVNLVVPLFLDFYASLL